MIDTLVCQSICNTYSSYFRLILIYFTFFLLYDYEKKNFPGTLKVKENARLDRTVSP